MTAAAVTIEEIAIADEPAAWVALGFAVDGDTLALGGVRVRLVGRSREKGVLGWSLRGVAVSGDIDGLPTTFSTRPPRDPAPAHPNGVTAIDHVVAFSPWLDRTVGALLGAGLDLRRVRDEPTPAGAPRQAFFRLGEVILEVVQIRDEEIERAGGVNAPARFWGLALLSADIERTAAMLGERMSEVRPAVQPGRRIATVRRSAGLAVTVAVMSAAPDVAA